MGNIFNKKSRIFKSKVALSERYLPENLIEREQQIKEIADLLEPVLHNIGSQNTIISGKKGTGKTTVLKLILKDLNEVIENEKLKIATLFLNCEKISTTSQAILEIINSISSETEVPKTGLSIGEYYKILWDALNKKRFSIIVVFDNIEFLKDHKLLSVLALAGENMHVSDEIFIGIIGISNNIFFSEKLDTSITRSLDPKNIMFPPYDQKQIAEILLNRSALAFEDNVIEESVISLCSALSVKEGYVHRGLTLLEKAGTIAENRDETVITNKHVYLANDELDSEVLFESLNSLPIHSKLVLLSILELAKELDDKITTGQVVSKYEKLCSKIELNPLGRTSVSKIISDFDMKRLISAPVRSKGRYGKTRLISIKNTDKIQEALSYDYRLNAL